MLQRCTDVSWSHKLLQTFCTWICTKMTAKIKWSTHCEQAFRDLKQSLISAPILTLPDFSKQFVLDTDASDFVIGGVL